METVVNLRRFRKKKNTQDVRDVKRYTTAAGIVKALIGKYTKKLRVKKKFTIVLSAIKITQTKSK